jgi:WD40 repeat protein
MVFAWGVGQYTGERAGAAALPDKFPHLIYGRGAAWLPTILTTSPPPPPPSPPPFPQVYAKRQGSGDQSGGINFFAWGPVGTSSALGSRRPSYTFTFNVNDKIVVAAMDFDLRIMRYATTQTTGTVPASGFLRVYTSGTMDATGRYVLAGTTAGEVAVYMLGDKVSQSPAGPPAATALYKTALLAGSNGVHSVLPVRAPVDGRVVLYVGGGDGALRCFTGRELEWGCTAEARLQGRVVSMSLSASGAWMLVGTAAGHVYRVSFGGNMHTGLPAGRAAVDLLEASHTTAVTAATFHPHAPDAVATVSTDQTLRLWNLNSYGVTWGAYTTTATHPTAAWLTTPFEGGGGAGGGAGVPSTSPSQPAGPGVPCDLYAGYADGTLRAFSVGGASSAAAGSAQAAAAAAAASSSAASAAAARGGTPNEIWRVNAHRGGVTCVAGNRAIVVTGGGDGRVNVWARRSHDLLLSFNDHSRAVIAVVVDVANPELLYSVGQDRIINTYNLRAERRIRQHALPQAETTACGFTSVAQLRAPASDRELVAATTDGRLFVYDPAVPDMHVGVVDVLALLMGAARAGVGAGKGVGEAVSAPRARQGQTRPELRINAVAVSPTGAFLAVVTQCGRLVVLAPGSAAASGGGAGARRPATTFTDLSGTVRPSITSPASHMTLASFYYGASPYTDVKWAPDERQLVVTAADACIAVFNWYGEDEFAAGGGGGGGAGLVPAAPSQAYAGGGGLRR